MINSPPQPSPWPATADSLCGLLSIHGDEKFQCHWTTKSNRDCTRLISKSNKSCVDKLLDRIVSQGNLGKARAALEEVAQLLVCQRSHQEYGPALFSRWEQRLEAAETRSAQRNADRGVSKKELSPPIKEESAESSRILSSQPLSSLAVKSEETLARARTGSCPKQVATNGRLPVPKRPNTEDISLNPPRALAATITREDTPRQRAFEPFGEPKTIAKRNQMLKDKIRRPLLPTETPKPSARPGHVYMYILPDGSAPYIKIGNARDVQKRKQNFVSTCGYEPKVIETFCIPLYVKVERLVHAQLCNERLRECGCPKCGRRHHEWFDVESSEASRIVGMWARWSRLEPYDEYGFLKTQWLVKLDSLDLEDAHCWEWFVDASK